MLYTSEEKIPDDEIIMCTRSRSSGYGDYWFCTKDKSYKEANRKADKFAAIGIGLMITWILLVLAAFIILGINDGTENHIGPHLWSLTIAGMVCLLVAVTLFGISLEMFDKAEKHRKIYDSFWETDEYKADMEKMQKNETKLVDKIRQKKASDLITVYDTLDNKELKKQEKIKIIKEFMRG